MPSIYLLILLCALSTDFYANVWLDRNLNKTQAAELAKKVGPPLVEINGESIVSSSSSSLSCRAASTDIPDPLSPLLPIVHRHWQAFRATFRILT